MHVSRLVLFLTIMLPQARAASAAPKAMPGVDSSCTFTANFAPPGPPVDGSPSMTVTKSAEQYAVSTFTVEAAPHGASGGIVTVTAQNVIFDDIEALARQHTAIARAAFACPSHEASFINAKIASVARRGDAFAFTLAYGAPRPRAVR